MGSCLTPWLPTPKIRFKPRFFKEIPDFAGAAVIGRACTDRWVVGVQQGQGREPEPDNLRGIETAS